MFDINRVRRLIYLITIYSREGHRIASVTTEFLVDISINLFFSPYRFIVKVLHITISFALLRKGSILRFLMCHRSSHIYI